MNPIPTIPFWLELLKTVALEGCVLIAVAALLHQIIRLPKAIRWPGVVWLLGCGLVLARIAVARVLFWRLQRRANTKERGLQAASMSIPTKHWSFFKAALSFTLKRHECRAPAPASCPTPSQYDANSAVTKLAAQIGIRRNVRVIETTNRLTHRDTLVGMGIGGSGFKSNLGKRVERLLRIENRRWRPLKRATATAIKVCATALVLSVAASCSTSENVTSAPLGKTVQRNWRQSIASIAAAQVKRQNLERNPANKDEPDESITEFPGFRVDEKRIRAAVLVQDGKLLFETGKVEEARQALTEALEIDPANQAAHYYRNLVNEHSLSTTWPILPLPPTHPREPGDRQEKLVQTIFRLDPNRAREFFDANGFYPKERLYRLSPSASHEGVIDDRGLKFQKAFRDYFASRQIVADPATTVTFNFASGILVVRAPEADMNAISKALEEMKPGESHLRYGSPPERW